MDGEMSQTPLANRTRISLFGKRNAGKSSLANALTGQSVAIVSDVPGTTTDPVSKTMEILPLGPCVVTDTAGLDDAGVLGAERVKRSLAVLDATDIVLLAVPADGDCGGELRKVEDLAKKRSLPVVVARTKCDLVSERKGGPGEIFVSAKTGEGVDALRAALAAAVPPERPGPLVSDLVARGDIVVCVCPIDAAAPKGRLILPQQQVVRELLDSGASALVCQPGELASVVARVGAENVKFAVTDSQAFESVDAALPEDIPLTSFSIVFARQKGDLETLVAGAEALERLKDGDTVLVAEGCTHRRQCGDIGTAKIPAWIRAHTGKDLKFVFASGGDFPLESRPALIVHCGGCMLSRRAVLSRLARASAEGIPIVNYGVAIAAMHGIVANPRSCFVRRAR